MTTNNIRVSVIVPTYNQEKYISQCISGILMQKTDFPVEIVIGDDCSTDNNRYVIQKEIQKNIDPLKTFKLLFHESNLGPNDFPGKFNWMKCLDNSTGKYIAICEGDDYWIDPFKLQKQVNFLEKNPSFSSSFHHVFRTLSKNNHDITKMKIYKGCALKKISNEDLLKNKYSIFHTSSFLFKSKYLNLPDWFNQVASGDMAIFSLIAENGPIGFVPGIMSVYREHPGGTTKSANHNQELANQRILMLELLDKHFNYKYTAIIKRTIEAFKQNKPVPLPFFERLKNKLKKFT